MNQQESRDKDVNVKEIIEILDLKESKEKTKKFELTNERASEGEKPSQISGFVAGSEDDIPNDSESEGDAKVNSPNKSLLENSKPAEPKKTINIGGDSKNWFENHKNLQRIYESDNSGDLAPFPDTWKELEKWFECIDEDISTIELKVLIKRIKPDDYMCINAVKEFLVKNKFLGKRDFDKIWKTINEPEDDSVNVYHEIEIKLREKFDIVSYKREILVKVYNAYTNNLDVIYSYLSLLAEKYSIGYRGIKGDVLEKLKDSSIVDMDFFCYDSWLLNFQNGYYNFINNEFVKAKDCTKEFVFAINRNYTPNETDCPIFKKALDGYLKYNNIITKDDIFEFMSYSLMFGNFLKAFFLNIGDTNTGKTQIMEVLKAFVPVNNRLQVSLQRLTKDQFGSMGLNNIILCYYDDLSDKIIYDLSTIKAITGGASEISIEVKHGAKIDAKNTAKIWQNGNYLPKIHNTKDTAYLDRVVIIEFMNEIDRYSEKHKDQFYLTITENQSEMKGIITELIEAGKRLYNRGNFRELIKNYAKNSYVYESNEIIAFLQDCTNPKIKDSISFNIAKDLVNEYRINRKKPLYSSQEIKKAFELEGYFKGQTNINNNREYIIKGLSWKKTEAVQKQVDDYFEDNS